MDIHEVDEVAKISHAEGDASDSQSRSNTDPRTKIRMHTIKLA
jgi:hypothetical protein